eukprot:Unigene8027_Nuclearia_a/m.24643 Unigene8027_Nuclearia_a/g.24643  ORF Unigene8027_Nuclearia_a/g.24643 Unigene8027_Nuclearia_a/m.24643 type:complete len:118 (-) Unigene8027_Nuclearia_a:80-433(-)
MNAPDRFELFMVPLGRSKVTVNKNTKFTDAATFIFEAEDHTLGNLLRMRLLENPQVLFAGYKMPHPLEHRFILNVQTRPTTTPEQVLVEAIVSLRSDLDSLRVQYQNEIQRVQPSAF